MSLNDDVHRRGGRRAKLIAYRVRVSIAEELARRDADNPAVVMDRDPVPTRHTAAVQKYSEEVGKGVMP